MVLGEFLVENMSRLRFKGETQRIRERFVNLIIGLKDPLEVHETLKPIWT